MKLGILPKIEIYSKLMKILLLQLLLLLVLLFLLLVLPASMCVCVYYSHSHSYYYYYCHMQIIVIQTIVQWLMMGAFFVKIDGIFDVFGVI